MDQCRAFKPQGLIVDKCGTCFRKKDEHGSQHPPCQSATSSSTVSKMMTMSATGDGSQRTSTVVSSTTSTRFKTEQILSFSDAQSSAREHHRMSSPFFDDHDFGSGSERRTISTWRDDSAIGKSMTSHSYSRNVSYGQGTPSAIMDRAGDVAKFRVRLAQLMDDDHDFEMDTDVSFQGDSSVYSTYEDLSSLPIDKDSKQASLPEERQANLELRSPLVESANVNKSLDSLVIQKEAEPSQELKQERVRSRSLGAKEGLQIEVNGNTDVAKGEDESTRERVSPVVGTSSASMAEEGVKIKIQGSPARTANSDPAADSSVDQQNANNRKQLANEVGETKNAAATAAKRRPGDKMPSKPVETKGKAPVTKPNPSSAGVKGKAASAASAPSTGPRTKVERSGEDSVEAMNNKVAEVEQLKSRVSTLQSRIVDMEKEAASLIAENQELRASQLPESVRNQDPHKALVELKTKLEAREKEYNDLKQSHEDLKAELEEIQIEMDEVRDTFREGEIEEFREIQKQLDSASKNCRVMQYRLRKAEKKIEDLEADKKSVTDKLSSRSGAKLSNGGNNNGGAMNDMQQELKVAKDVSVRLHLELESMEEKRGRIEEENQLLRRKLVDSEKHRKEMKREIEKVRIELHRKEVELLKRKLGQIQDDALNEEQRRKMQKLQESGDGNVEYDVSALMAELHEKTERERDLQHQLQLVEEEANVMRRKLGEIEQERERLEFELEKYKMHFGTLESPRKESEKGNISEKEAELRLQLMMTEQEATVMHRKISELETKNEELMAAIIKPDAKDAQRGDAKGGESDELRHYMEENENLKQHLDDAENEIHHLVAKLDKYEELSTLGVIHKNDNDEQIEVKQFIQLKEEENIAIRKRLVEAEVINRIVEDEVRTYKKLNEDALGHSSSKGKGKGAEAKLKSQISLLKQENDRMRKRMVDCEIQNETLQEEIQRYRSKGDGSVSAPPSSQEQAMESDKLPELQGKVIHLEEQLGDLISIVKGKEQVQEQQEEELKHAHRTLERASTEAKRQQERLERDLGLAVEKQKHLMKQLETVETHAHILQSELDQTYTEDDSRAGPRRQGLSVKVRELELHLEEEQKKSKTLEKKLELINESASDNLSVCSDDMGQREREKELLRFELNESQSMMAEANEQIRSLQEELAKERESREKERRDQERRIAEIGEEKENLQNAIEMEKDNAEHQRKMDTKAWRREKTELYQQLEDFKQKTDELHRKLQTEQSNWAKEDFSNKGAKSGDTTPTSPDWYTEKAELERVRQKLEAETQKLENDSSKHRAKSEELRAKMEVMTAENEELKASRDILTEERALLHSKLTETQQEKSALEVTLKKERSSWDKEKATARFEIDNERKRRENELKKAKDENDRLRREKSQSDFGHKHYEVKLKEFERKALELNELLKKKEEAFAKDKARISDEYAKKLQSATARIEKEKDELKSNHQVKETEMQTKLKELQSKVEERESENVKLKNKLKDTEVDEKDLRGKIRELEQKLAQEQTTEKTTTAMAAQMTELESSKKETEKLTREKTQLLAKLSTNEGEWKREKEQLKEAMEKLKCSLKAREESWVTERNELDQQKKQAEGALREKEAKWVAENSTLSHDVKHLKMDLQEREASWERERKDLQKNLNEKATGGERSSAEENELKAEFEKLQDQLKRQVAELATAQERLRGAEDALEENEHAWKREKSKLSQQAQVREKLHKGEISALQFRLEAEARSGREVKSRLESRARNEMKEKDRQKQITADVQSELSTAKAQFDNERKAWEKEKVHLQKQATEAKEGKRLLLELRRNVDSLQQKLAVEEKLRGQTQNAYVTEKSSWEIERSEMQVRLARFEHHVKGSSKKSKEKAEEQIARLKESWERERHEHKRLLAESHAKNLDLQRQVASMERTLQSERREFETKMTSERKDWHDEKAQLVGRIKEVEAENQLLREWETRTKEEQARRQRDQNAWKAEREEYQKKLEETEKANALDKTKMDEIILEMEKLKDIAKTFDQVDTDYTPKFTDSRTRRETPQRDTDEQKTPTIQKPLSSVAKGTNLETPQFETMTFDPSTQITQYEQVKVTTTLPVYAAHAHNYLTGGDRIAWDAGDESTDHEVDATLAEALKEIEKVTDELAQYQAELSMTDRNMNLRRSKSHPDVSPQDDATKQGKTTLYQSSSLSRSVAPPKAGRSPRERPSLPLTERTTTRDVDTTPAASGRKVDGSPGAGRTEQAHATSPVSPSTVVSEKLAHTSISHSTQVPKVTSSVATGDVSPVTDQKLGETTPTTDDRGRTSPPSKLVADPVVGRSRHFDFRGLLRPTEKKKPLLPWMQEDGKAAGDGQRDQESARDSRVMSAKKMFENGATRSREASPAPGRLTSPMTEKPRHEITKPATATESKESVTRRSPKAEEKIAKTPTQPVETSTARPYKTVEEKSPSPGTPSSPNRQIESPTALHGKPPVPVRPESGKKPPEKTSPKTLDADRKGTTYSVTPPKVLYLKRGPDPASDRQTSPSDRELAKMGYSPNGSRTPTPPIREGQFIPEKLSPEPLVPIIPGNLTRTKNRMQHQEAVWQQQHSHSPQLQQQQRGQANGTSPPSPRTARAKFFAESHEAPPRPDRFDRSLRSRSLSPPGFRLSGEPLKFSLPPAVPPSSVKPQKSFEDKTTVRDRSPSPSNMQQVPSRSTSGHQPRTGSQQQDKDSPPKEQVTATAAPPATVQGKSSADSRASPKMGTKSVQSQDQRSGKKTSSDSKHAQKATKTTKKSSVFGSGGKSGSGSSSSDNAFSQITAGVVPLVALRFPKPPKPANRRAPSRWLHRRLQQQTLHIMNGQMFERETRRSYSMEDHSSMKGALEILRRFCETAV